MLRESRSGEHCRRSHSQPHYARDESGNMYTTRHFTDEEEQLLIDALFGPRTQYKPFQLEKESKCDEMTETRESVSDNEINKSNDNNKTVISKESIGSNVEQGQHEKNTENEDTSGDVVQTNLTELQDSSTINKEEQAATHHEITNSSTVDLVVVDTSLELHDNINLENGNVTDDVKETENLVATTKNDERIQMKDNSNDFKAVTTTIPVKTKEEEQQEEKEKMESEVEEETRYTGDVVSIGDKPHDLESLHKIGHTETQQQTCKQDKEEKLEEMEKTITHPEEEKEKETDKCNESTAMSKEDNNEITRDEDSNETKSKRKSEHRTLTIQIPSESENSINDDNENNKTEDNATPSETASNKENKIVDYDANKMTQWMLELRGVCEFCPAGVKKFIDEYLSHVLSKPTSTHIKSSTSTSFIGNTSNVGVGTTTTTTTTTNTSSNTIINTNVGYSSYHTSPSTRNNSEDVSMGFESFQQQPPLLPPPPPPPLPTLPTPHPFYPQPFPLAHPQMYNYNINSGSNNNSTNYGMMNSTNSGNNSNNFSPVSFSNYGSPRSTLDSLAPSTIETISELWEDRKNTPIAINTAQRSRGLFGAPTKKNIQQMVISVLNKVTTDPEKYREVKNELLRLPIPEASAEQLEEIAASFFNKAVSEQHFCHCYADLIESVCKMYESTSSSAHKTKSLEYRLRCALLQKCQREFINSSSEDLKSRISSKTELAERANERRRKMKGNVLFISELYLRGVVADTVMMTIFYFCATGEEHGSFRIPPKHTPTEGQIDQLIVAVETVGSKFFVENSYGRKLLPKLRANLEHWKVHYPVSRCCYLLMSSVDKLVKFENEVEKRRESVSLDKSTPSHESHSSTDPSFSISVPPLSTVSNTSTSISTINNTDESKADAKSTITTDMTNTVEKNTLDSHEISNNNNDGMDNCMKNDDSSSNVINHAQPSYPLEQAKEEVLLKTRNEEQLQGAVHETNNNAVPSSSTHTLHPTTTATTTSTSWKQDNEESTNNNAEKVPLEVNSNIEEQTLTAHGSITQQDKSNVNNNEQEIKGNEMARQDSDLKAGDLNSVQDNKTSTNSPNSNISDIQNNNFTSVSKVTSLNTRTLSAHQLGSNSNQHIPVPRSKRQDSLSPKSVELTPVADKTTFPTTVATTSLMGEANSKDDRLKMNIEVDSNPLVSSTTMPINTATPPTKDSTSNSSANVNITTLPKSLARIDSIPTVMLSLKTNKYNTREVAFMLIDNHVNLVKYLAAWFKRCLTIFREESTRLKTGELLSELSEHAPDEHFNKHEVRELAKSTLQRCINDNEQELVKIYKFWAQLVLSDRERAVFDERMLNEGLKMVLEISSSSHSRNNNGAEDEDIVTYLIDVARVYYEMRNKKLITSSDARTEFARYRPLLELFSYSAHCKNEHRSKLMLVDNPTICTYCMEAQVLVALINGTMEMEELTEHIRTSPLLESDTTLASEVLSGILIAECYTNKTYLEYWMAILQMAIDGAHREDREMALAIDILNIVDTLPSESQYSSRSRIFTKLIYSEVISEETLSKATNWRVEQRKEYEYEQSSEYREEEPLLPPPQQVEEQQKVESHLQNSEQECLPEKMKEVDQHENDQQTISHDRKVTKLKNSKEVNETRKENVMGNETCTTTTNNSNNNNNNSNSRTEVERKSIYPAKSAHPSLTSQMAQLNNNNNNNNNNTNHRYNFDAGFNYNSNNNGHDVFDANATSAINNNNHYVGHANNNNINNPVVQMDMRVNNNNSNNNINPITFTYSGNEPIQPFIDQYYFGNNNNNNNNNNVNFYYNGDNNMNNTNMNNNPMMMMGMPPPPLPNNSTFPQVMNSMHNDNVPYQTSHEPMSYPWASQPPSSSSVTASTTNARNQYGQRTPLPTQPSTLYHHAPTVGKNNYSANNSTNHNITSGVNDGNTPFYYSSTVINPTEGDPSQPLAPISSLTGQTQNTSPPPPPLTSTPLPPPPPPPPVPLQSTTSSSSISTTTTTTTTNVHNSGNRNTNSSFSRRSYGYNNNTNTVNNNGSNSGSNLNSRNNSNNASPMPQQRYSHTRYGATSSFPSSTQSQNNNSNNNNYNNGSGSSGKHSNYYYNNNNNNTRRAEKGANVELNQ